MPDREGRRQRTLVVGCGLVIAAIVAITVLAWPGDASHRLTASARASRATSTTTTAPPTTTTAAPATTVSIAPVPTTTTRAPTTTTRAPATTTTGTPVTAAGTAGLVGIAGKTVVVDPGHNGQNYRHTTEINQPVDIGTKTLTCDTTGTQTKDGYTESAYNLDVALRLAAILRGAGANVVMTRNDNNGWGPCINERAAIGNRAKADAGISIHADGGPVSGRGFHVIFPPSIAGLTDDIAVNSKRLALDVRGTYRGATGMPYSTYVGAGDALSERSDLGGLNLSDVPKIFIETGNMQNQADTALLESDGFRQQAAQGIAEGLARYLRGQ
jgi:N-acetylmuramoyl-L-alanine amidase